MNPHMQIAVWGFVCIMIAYTNNVLSDFGVLIFYIPCSVLEWDVFALQVQWPAV